MKNNVIVMMMFISLFSISCDKDDEVTIAEKGTEESSDFILTSEAVLDGLLLDDYKCEDKVDGKESSIPLAWSGVPEGTESLAISMTHYPHADDKTNVSNYLILWGINPDVSKIAYGMADDGDWFMGANKDESGVSYTSPCSPSAGSKEYTLTIFALSEVPASLPQESTVEVTYDVFTEALSTVTTVGEASLTFDSVTQ